MATEFYCQYACVLSKITKKKLVKLHGESPQFPRVLDGTYIEYKVKKANSTQKLLWLVPILKLYLNWITALLLSCFARKTNVSTDFFFFTYYMYEFALQSVTQRITPAEMFLRLQNITFRTVLDIRRKKSFIILAKWFLHYKTFFNISCV